MPTFETTFAELKPNLVQQDQWRDLQLSPPSLIADFSTNDYLGLARDAAVIDAGYATAKQYGGGATGSRLLSGNLQPHIMLEQAIAKAKGVQAALIFNSGFQANATVLASLLDKKILKQEPLVFADKLNHASLHHACQLSGVRQIRYQHNNLDHLQKFLEKYRYSSQPKFIVSETVFGMDGDAVDIARLASLADQYNAFLYLDEAHATGIVGQNGYGLACGWIANRGLAMGTFSKALGVSGAYIACSQIVRDYLINRCTGFIYTTAPSPYVVGSAYCVWQRLIHMQAPRSQLLIQAEKLRQRLQAMGFDTGSSSTHIIPIIVGQAKTAMVLRDWLLDRGILVSAIRPPSVPLHTARIRLALCTTHTHEQIEALLDALSQWCERN